jgi:aminopeptidase-like protein
MPASADRLERTGLELLAAAVETCLELADVVESNRCCTNLSPSYEPPVGRGSLNCSAGRPVDTPDDDPALRWELKQNGGRSTLLPAARSSGLRFPVVRRAAERLKQARLLR